MFQPISHCCSCLLWAEAGPESHLFHLSRSSNLERHQKAREERLWAWWAGKPASTFAGMRPTRAPRQAALPLAQVCGGICCLWNCQGRERQLLFPQTLSFLFVVDLLLDIVQSARCDAPASENDAKAAGCREEPGWFHGADCRVVVSNMFPLKYIHRNTKL